MKTRNFKNLIPLFLALFLLLALTACTTGTDNNSDSFSCEKERFFIESADDTYYMAEIIYPSDYDGDMPLVAMAHGFKGTLNSGGAEELSERLASAGIAAVRVDFNPRVAANQDAEKTNFYDLSSMQDTLLAAINYASENYDIDQSRIGLYARSMGGRVVMRMANESYGNIDYKALTMVAPAGDKNAMVHYFGGQTKWQEAKKKAAESGYIEYQGQSLTPEWFTEFEDYNPCDYGYKFGDKPVLVICNTEDYVVTEKTSNRCADAYKNSRIITVTTDDYHGYEMSYENSELKDQLMNELVNFFCENL